VYNVSKKKMVRADHFMRAFRYKDALDDVLKVRTMFFSPLLIIYLNLFDSQFFFCFV
jgi:hypothetical protein